MSLQDSELLERLKAEAEIEMRRDLDEGRPYKRRKQSAESEAEHFVPVDRFRYSVVEDLEAGASGFIVTCNFRREKSATREASLLLRRYLPAHLFPQRADERPGDSSKQQEQHQQQQLQQQEQERQKQQEQGTQRTKSDHTADCDGDSSGTDDEVAASGPGGCTGVAAGQDEPGGGAGAAGPGQPSVLALAKVGCRGVVLMRLSAEAAAVVDPVGVVAAMLRDLEAGSLQPPKHCQRIIPLEATCALTAAGLARAVSGAAAAHRRRCQASGSSCAAATADAAAAVQSPFTYAVVYRSRQVEVPVSESTAPATVANALGATATATGPTATAAAGSSSAARGAAVEGPNGAEVGPCGEGMGEEPLSDRGRIISIVAAGMASAFGDNAKVNLKKPQVAVLVEAVPVAGRQFAGVALLGQELFHAKGKLVTKPLIKNAPN